MSGEIILPTLEINQSFGSEVQTHHRGAAVRHGGVRVIMWLCFAVIEPCLVPKDKQL